MRTPSGLPRPWRVKSTPGGGDDGQCASSMSQWALMRIPTDRAFVVNAYPAGSTNTALVTAGLNVRAKAPPPAVPGMALAALLSGTGAGPFTAARRRLRILRAPRSNRRSQRQREGSPPAWNSRPSSAAQLLAPSPPPAVDSAPSALSMRTRRARRLLRALVPHVQRQAWPAVPLRRHLVNVRFTAAGLYG